MDEWTLDEVYEWFVGEDDSPLWGPRRLAAWLGDMRPDWRTTDEDDLRVLIDQACSDEAAERAALAASEGER